MAIEDLIANEGVIITITHNSLIKRTNISSYRAQRRGGRGVIGMTTREGDKPEDDDFVEHLFTASTHDYLMFFTNTGRVYVERVHEIPDMGRASKGRSIANLARDEAGRKSRRAHPRRIEEGRAGRDTTWKAGGFVLFATQQGTVKKTSLEDFANCRKGGIIAIGIEQGDNLIEVKLTSGTSEAVLITREGMSIRFEESDVRSMGRPATGVRGISLDKDDRVVALAVVDSERDAARRRRKRHRQAHRLRRIPHQTRGGKGIITMKTNDKTGASSARSPSPTRTRSCSSPSRARWSAPR
jgi:DNA gyrase subunit A